MYKIKTNVFTEKGKIKTKVRTFINDDLKAKLILTNDSEVELKREKDGKFYGIIAKDIDGKEIYAKVEVIITEKPFVFKEKQIEPLDFE